MSNENRVNLFDRWAESYDRAVDAATDFPFVGYDDVMNTILAKAATGPGMRVLDMGTGTGKLSERFVAADCEVWGVDFSLKMLEQARRRVPGATLVHADLLQEFPHHIPTDFDRVVSAYAFHEFDLSTKVAVLTRIAHSHLASDGFMIIGDIGFPTAHHRLRARQQWADLWDDEEEYWIGTEAQEALEQAGFTVCYQQVSVCASTSA